MNPERIIERLRELQRLIRDAVVNARAAADLSGVDRAAASDTIYRLDVLIEPIVVDYCDHWSRELPMVVVAEGIEPETGRCFPAGSDPAAAPVRVIFDPVDGTRGLMYDKRAAWSLAGVALNRGEHTRLRDIQAAVMSELPTSKMGRADVLWAVRGGGAAGVREDLAGGERPLALRPSTAESIDHGFCSVTDFFPGTKVLAGELAERIVAGLVGPADVTRATVFEDQYISTGGQFYELIVGHDRFNADLRPLFYRMQGQPEGLCCHPYDVCTALVAEEAGVILTDGLGAPLDGPLDTTTGVHWAGFANRTLMERIGPVLADFFAGLGQRTA